MLSSSFSYCFFIQLVFITIFYKYTTNGTNVTFIPEPIHLTVDDLPAPYATPSVTKVPHILPVPENPTLYVPDGFTVKLYMSGLISPRYLIYTPTGDILVSEPNANRISCLIDSDGDGYPDDRQTFADASNELNRPYDMAFADGYFYVDNQNATRRYSWTNGSRQIEGTGEVVMSYDQDGLWTRTIAVSPDNDRVYIGIGSASNASVEPLPRATVQIANIDGSNATTFASGLKNPVGLGFHPVTKDLYVACQERDGLGDDLVPNYFTRIEQDDFYGWPYAYMSSNLTDPRRRLPDGTSERPDLVNITRTPDVLFQAHSAVLDTLFYTGVQFPTRYHNGVFAAFHGSVNRNISIGYNIVFIPFNDTTHSPLGYYEEFVKGFLTNLQEPDTFGRPVGLLVLKDGSLLFTEDGNNRIYQVQYNNNKNKSHRLVLTEFLFISSVFISFFIMRK